MSDETAKCAVCGDELDFYGCLGEMRGRHVPIEMKALKQDLEAAMSLSELHGRLLEEREAQLARVVSGLRELAGAWEALAKETGPVPSSIYARCAEEVRKLSEVKR